MLDEEIRRAVITLHGKELGQREIARALDISRNSVKAVLRNETGTGSGNSRGSRLDEHLDAIRQLHQECRDGQGRVNLVRVWEELKNRLEREGRTLDASYSALTWFCREHGIGVREKVPAGRIVTDPGEEMQHDTSPYVLELGGRKVKRQCASLVLGYSRMIYVQFYPKFDRFVMKVFLTEAFRYFGGVCGRCVIDNTSVALACGSGSRAQMAPEVEAFEERFSFRFMAHEIMDSDRKGKVERPFDFVERNFLVGRHFADDEDLNRQALEWTDKAQKRRLREFKASPLELFAMEKPLLKPLPTYVPEVYRLFQRMVDAYGCVNLNGQKYPAPAAWIGKEVMVHETRDRVLLKDKKGTVLADHPKKWEGSPPDSPRHPDAPRRQKSAQLAEEDRLKALGEPMTVYLESLKAARGPRYSWSVRKLWRLRCRYPETDLLTAVARAWEHRLFDVNRLETVLLQTIAQNDYQLPMGFTGDESLDVVEYQKGAVTPEPDLNNYIPDGDDDAR
jgi:transposase